MHRDQLNEELKSRIQPSPPERLTSQHDRLVAAANNTSPLKVLWPECIFPLQNAILALSVVLDL